jgi:hypothetical protein
MFRGHPLGAPPGPKPDVIIRRMAVIQPRAKLFQHNEPPIYRTFRQVPPNLVKA